MIAGDVFLSHFLLTFDLFGYAQRYIVQSWKKQILTWTFEAKIDRRAVTKLGFYIQKVQKLDTKLDTSDTRYQFSWLANFFCYHLIRSVDHAWHASDKS